MDKKRHKQQPYLQYSPPYYKNKSGSKRHDRSDKTSRKTFGSWFSFKNIIGSGSKSDIDKAIDVLSSVFNVQSEPVKNNKKSKSRRSRPKSHIIRIDLKKIDEDSSLSNGEKIRLKKILNRIRYEEPNIHRRRTCVKSGRGKSMVFNKASKVNIIQSQQICCKNVRRKRRESDCPLCKHYKTNSEASFGNKNQLVKKVNYPLAKLSLSEERLFETLIHLDRSCCNDSFRDMIDRKFCTADPRKINIENIELKYINPTCIIQCNTVDTSAKAKGRLSEAALASHFGVIPCPVKEEHVTHPHEIYKPIHYDDDVENISATSLSRDVIKPRIYLSHSECSTGIQTESMRKCDKNKQTANKDDGSLDMVSEELGIQEISSGNVNKGGNVEDDVQSDKTATEIIINHTSRCRKLINFARKCFCLGCTEEKEEAMSSKVKKNTDKNAKLMKKVNSPKIKAFQAKERAELRRRLNSPKVKIVRTTEQEFNKGSGK